jgi:hypothetical protein
MRFSGLRSEGRPFSDFHSLMKLSGALLLVLAAVPSRAQYPEPNKDVGATLGVDGSPGVWTASLGLRFERDLPRDWTAGVEVDANSPVSVRQGGGEVQSFEQRGVLYARLNGGERHGNDFGLFGGAGANHYFVSASGYAVNRSASLFVPVVRLGAQYRFRTDQVSLTVYVRTDLQPWQEELDISGVGAVLTLPAWSVGGGIALGFRLL